MPYATATCPNCGREFRYMPTRSKKPQRYCSRECQKQGSRVTTHCPTCGKEFWYHKCWPRIYCSRACSAAQNIGRQLGVVPVGPQFCEQCGREITQDKRTGRRFCGASCFGAWLRMHNTGENHSSYKPENRVDHTCEQCGKPFTATASEVAKGWGRFCSRSCAARWQSLQPDAFRFSPMIGSDNPNWKGGYAPYYGPNWRTQRRNARRRDNYTCQRCGITEDELGRQLDVHHIHRFGDFGPERYQEANRLDNLISLCFTCHTWVGHHGLDAATP